MQSHIHRYITTANQKDYITPAVIGYTDVCDIVSIWSGKQYTTLDKIKKDYIPGLYIYETPEDKKEFPISEVRRCISDTTKRPYEGNTLNILLGIDTGSLESMNALLKLLEDTPAYTIILLVVSDRESLLETIHSRTINLFRDSHHIVDDTHRKAIRDFFTGKDVSWITALFGMKPTREEALDILTLALGYAPSEYIDPIEQGLIDLYTTNESPRSILDVVFLR